MSERPAATTVGELRASGHEARSVRAEIRANLLDALAAGDTEPRQVVERVYADVPREVWPYAELSVRAQLDYLRYRSPDGGRNVNE